MKSSLSDDTRIMHSRFTVAPWPEGTTIAQMVKAGKYGWSWDEMITDDHFSAIHSQASEVVLLQFILETALTDIQIMLDRHGLRHASLPELLALGAAHPDLQYGDEIVAFGSVWKDPRFGVIYVPCLAHGRDPETREESRTCTLTRGKYRRYDGSTRFATVLRI